MNFFGRSKSRSPSDHVKQLREQILKLDTASSTDTRKRVNEDITRSIQGIKVGLCGDAEHDASPDVITQIANEVYAQDILGLIVSHLSQLDFEARKDVGTIYGTLLRRQLGARSPTVEYLSGRPEILFGALRGYRDPDVALHAGMILKEMLKYEPMARILLYSEEFYTFPAYIEQSTFGISCDAFAAMKDCLTRHKTMVAQYLEANYDRFFAMTDQLVQSANYVTKRQSLKMLGEILLDRSNYNIMTRYIANEANLKMMMNFLRDKSRNIQYEAFHVFKVFVANPNKPPQIAAILRRNKDKLTSFLNDFHNDKDDEQFRDEKEFLKAQIGQL